MKADASYIYLHVIIQSKLRAQLFQFRQKINNLFYEISKFDKKLVYFEIESIILFDKINLES